MFDTKEKKERSLGTKLGLKPFRSDSPKGAYLRRPFRPGAHGKRPRRSVSEFGRQLAEKQKIRFTYGIRNRELAQVFREALKLSGVTGENLMSLLERRLDNVVHRLGIAPSRSVGRQLTSHGHILVNGRKTDVPSYRVKIGDVITIRPQSANHALFKDVVERNKNYDPPAWLAFDADKMEGRILNEPRDLDVPFDVGLVVDYYSK